jgi:hypothetical protein
VTGRQSEENDSSVGWAERVIAYTLAMHHGAQSPRSELIRVWLISADGDVAREIADTFDKLFGITLTPGASAQVVRRAGTILQPVYEEIKEHIISSDHLTPDETGWRIGGHPRLAPRLGW